MEQRNEQNHKNIYDALLQFMDLASSSWQIGYRYLKTHPELLRKESEEILEEAIVMAKKFNNERSVNLFKLYRDMLILCQEIGVEAAFSKRMGIPLEELKGLIIRDAIQEKTQEIMKKLISAEPDIDISSEEDINRKLAKYPDLQEKLSITTRLVELNDDAPADLLTNLKQALVIDSRCERDSNSTLLIQCAVDSWEHIRHHRNFPQLPEAFQLLVIDGAGNAYLRRYKMTHHQDDLDQAICLLHDEMIHASKYLPRFLFILSSLSESLYIRYKLHMKFQDLEDAIYCMKEAIEKIDDDIENLPRLLNNLGQGLYDRYTQRKQVEDLEQAKECYTKALALTSPDSPTRADCLVGFGHVVASLYQHTRRAPYIPENIPDIADYFLHLGDAFLDLYKQKGELEDLEENIRSYIRAAFHASPSALEISDYLNKIAMSLSLRYRHIGQIENLEQAIEIFQYLLNHVETASPDRALYLGNMASALYDRFMYFENLEDLERAIQYYCQVREVALQHNDQSTVAHSSASLASCLNDWYIHTGKV